MKYHLVTLGCPKNMTDSTQLTRALRTAGHAPVDSPRAADLLIVVDALHTPLGLPSHLAIISPRLMSIK